MFCPKCKNEYREEFTHCADCGISLVNELPKEEPKNKLEYVDLVEVLRTNNKAIIAIIKSILDSENIPYLVQGEIFSAIRAPIPVRIMVPKDLLNKAKNLLKDIK
jgi:hypothetical protein